MARDLDRRQYAEIYGPTAGDRLRLGDTGLVVEVERDLTVPGDECVFGGGKVLRDGMGQATGVPDADALDLVVTNALAEGPVSEEGRARAVERAIERGFAHAEER